MLGQLNEVILYVQDMPQQVCFYRDVLGFPILEPTGSASAEDAYWVLFDTGPCKLALHGGGNCNLGEDAPKIVFAVEDIQAAHAQLTQAGLKLSDIRSPAKNIYVADAKDPEGNRFSIEQRKS